MNRVAFFCSIASLSLMADAQPAPQTPVPPVRINLIGVAAVCPNGSWHWVDASRTLTFYCKHGQIPPGTP